jgi:hypothetical protein
MNVKVPSSIALIACGAVWVLPCAIAVAGMATARSRTISNAALLICASS